MFIPLGECPGKFARHREGSADPRIHRITAAAKANFMERFQPNVYAMLRIATGFLFLWHGMQKLFGFPAEAYAGTPAFVTYIGGPIELLGGALVMIGLCTRWAAFICSGMMASAYWMVHGTQHLLPLLNEGEMAALYCFVFLFISARGSGIWSVDAMRSGA